MAGKMETKEKQVTAKKAAPAKKPAARAARKMDKGDYLVCGVCGLTVVVDDFGNAVAEELICCGEPMKEKAPKAKAKAKPAK
jgi:hypothetical protein